MATPSPRESTLMRIPAELRLLIYYYLVPHRSELSFAESGRSLRCIQYQHQSLLTHVRPRESDDVVSRERLNAWPTILPLMLVNSIVSREVRGVLYHENTFVFNISGRYYSPVVRPYNDIPNLRSLRSDAIFSPFNKPCHKRVLRQLRTIRLNMELPLSIYHWEFVRCRARFAYFVEVFNGFQQDCDAAGPPELSNLTICYKQRETRRWFAPSEVLEGLVGLRGIKHVELRRLDAPPSWFHRCLELHLQGEGGELARMEYPTRTVKRIAKRTAKTSYTPRYKKVVVQDKEFWEPVYDWLAFGRRNGILDMQQEEPDAKLGG